MIYILTLLGLFAVFLYYIVDSFQQKEYKFTVGFSFYAMFILFLIGQAIKMLIMMI
jgi:hypothetical protein